MKSKTLFSALASTLVVLSAQASTTEERSAQLQADFKAKMATIETELSNLKPRRPNDVEAVVGLRCEIKTGKHEIKLHLPEVAMRLQTWSAHVPVFWWGVTSVGPIKLHLPQTKMERQQMILHVPEVAMRLTKLAFDIPELRCGDVQAEFRSTEDRAKALGAQAKNLTELLQGDLKKLHLQDLERQRKLVVATFDDALGDMHAWIERVKGRNGNTAELVVAHGTLQKQRAEALASFDQAAAQLN